MFLSRGRARGPRTVHRLGWNRLQVHSLESRVAPAQLVVTSAADDGSAGTLRSVIAIANANGEADTITFASAVTSVTLATGQLTISEGKNLTIDGGGTVTISGAAKSGILRLTAVGSPMIAINDITIANGKVTGYSGAITMTSQQLFLTNVSLLNNKSTYGGGALSLTGSGSAVLSSCHLMGNTGSLGGAIYLDGYGTGSISLHSCLLDGNIADDYGLGGAIYAEEGKVVIDSCIIQNNQAGSWGGGIELERNSFATITNSTVARNVAKYAGGIDIWRGSATFVNCTIAENSADAYGGGISYYAPDSSPSSLVIRNCTIAKNKVSDEFSSIGGGLYTIISLSANPTVQIDSTIIASNFVSSSSGLSNLDVSYQSSSKSTLGKGSNNLFGVATSLITGINNLIGTTKSPIEAGLLPLSDYGGPLLTMALRANSIAVDKGSNPLGLMFDQRGQPRESPMGFPDIGAVEGTFAVPYVAKIGSVPNVTSVGGTAYKISVTYEGPNGIDLASIDGGDIQVSGPAPIGPVSVTGITTSGNQVIVNYQFTPPGGSWDQFDIGTYKVSLVDNEVWDLAQPAQFAPSQSLGNFKMQVAGNFVVDSIEDTVDGNFGPGQFTLREAVQFAYIFPTTIDTISFDPTTFATSKTIVLNTELNVSSFFKINGPGADLLTLSGNGTNRIFNASQGGMNAIGLTLANGRVNYVSFSDADNGNGGAIYGSSITLVDCVLINNSAQKQGGAIYAWDSISLTRCTVLNNTSSSGGGLFARGIITLENSTISGNTASYGGGLYLDDDDSGLIARNSTIANNSATNDGGAVYGYLGPSSSPTINVTLTSTIVAKNVSTDSPDFYFMKANNVAGDNNLIGVADTGNVTFTGTNNQTGTLAAPLDPIFGPLANNGGPTLTHALLPGSPAINAGSNPANLTTDQRGTGFNRVVGGQADIGAFEVQSPPPRASSFQVNDGSPQRSLLTSFKVSFSEAVLFPNGASTAFELTRTGPGTPTGNVSINAVASGSEVTITFVNGGAIALDPGGSLPDGRYQLSIIANQIIGAGGFLDGNGNGIPGDNAVFTTHRLFGDSNGDGTVSAFDYNAFRMVYSSASPVFDFNNDGVVSAADYQQFRLRYRVTI